MILFFDTSAVLKRYLVEKGSDVVDELLSLPDFEGGRLLSGAVLLETQAILALKHRIPNITTADYHRALNNLERDRRDIWTLLPVSNDVLLDAARSAALHADRGADGFDHLHIATAINTAAKFAGIEPLVFVASDEKLTKYAKFRTLPIFDPERHGVHDLLTGRLF